MASNANDIEGKRKMTGEFSWSMRWHSLNQQNLLVSNALQVPNLPNFEFTIRVIKNNEGNYCGRRMDVEVVKAPSKALYSELVINVMEGDEVYTRFSHPLHEWGDKACGNRDISCSEDELITLKCEISWFHQMAPLVYSPSSVHDIYKPFCLQSSFSDVKIIIGKEEIPAHKLILVANSSVLKSMFESDMKEGRENEVVINDITSDVMKNVLSFLYTRCDEPLEDSEMALKMLFVAEKYDMQDLKHCCEYKLHLQLTIANVLEFLEASDINNAEDLKKQSLSFMVDNKLAVLGDSEFKSLCLRRPNLMYAFVEMALKS